MKTLRLRSDDYRAVLEDETGYWTQTSHGLLYAGSRENAMALWRADERKDDDSARTETPSPRRRRATDWDFGPKVTGLSQMSLF